MSLPYASGPIDTQNTPMKEVLLHHLDRLSDLSYNLFSSIVPRDGGPQRPLPDASAFVAWDEEFAGIIRQARIHQIKHRRIEALKAEVVELDESLREILELLEGGRVELDALVDEGDEQVKAINKAKEDPIPYEDLMQYAEHLATFTSLPPSFPPYRTATAVPGAPPEALPFHLPFPTIEQLRRGRLNTEGTQMSIAGESRDTGVEAQQPPVPDAIFHGPAEGAAMHHPAPHHPQHPPAAQPAMADIFGDLDLNPDL